MSLATSGPPVDGDSKSLPLNEMRRGVAVMITLTV
jgi:hypothetical protein